MIAFALLRSSLVGADDESSAAPAANITFLEVGSSDSLEVGCGSAAFGDCTGCSDDGLEDLAALASFIVVLQVLFSDCVSLWSKLGMTLGTLI